MTGRDDDTPKAVRRLKRWTIAQKCRIVEETFVPGASVAIVARRNNVNANQVFGWRKKYRQGRLVDKKAPSQALPGHDLIRVGVVDHGGDICPPPVPSVPAPHEPVKVVSLPESRPSGLIEIELSGGIKLSVDTGFDEAALRRVLAVIREAA
jgi:transposase